MDRNELPPGDTYVEALAYESLQFVHAERSDDDLLEAAGLQRIGEAQRLERLRASTQGGQDTDRGLAGASRRERERASRGRVEPLHVVDGHEHRSVGGE